MSSVVTTLWWIYFVRTPDNRLYCGISTDVERRFRQHVSGKGAKALRGKSPLCLEWYSSVGERTLAARLEYTLKKQTKRYKERIVTKQLSASQIIQDLNISD